MPLIFQYDLNLSDEPFDIMTLTMHRNHISKIVAQIKEQWPREVCGYLSGMGDFVWEVHSVQNISTVPENSFEMEPQSQLNALVSVQDSKQEILAVYHSHPLNARQDLSERDLTGQSDAYRLQIVIVPNKRREIDSLRVFRLEARRPIEVQYAIEPD